MANSVAIKFDLYDNNGEGTNSTGLYTGGADPFNVGSIDLTPSGINLHSGDVFQVDVAYDGTQLSVTLTDTQTDQTATQDYTIDIPTAVGADDGLCGLYRRDRRSDCRAGFADLDIHVEFRRLAKCSIGTGGDSRVGDFRAAHLDRQRDR